MTQQFSLLWVEDNDRVVDSQIGDIERFLETKGFQLNLLRDDDGKKYQHFIGEEYIDIILTDYHISEDIKGTDIIKYVRDKRILTDILFYSVDESVFDDEETYAKLGKYGLIEVWEDKDIIEPLKDLIEKNIRRCEDIIFLRGVVISESVELELKINSFVAGYFKIQEELADDFHNFVLESGYVPMAGKKKWMSLILEKNNLRNDSELRGLLTKLDYVVKIRNLLAHCKTDPHDPQIMCSSGREEKFNRDDLKKMLCKIEIVSRMIDILTEKLDNDT